MSGGGGAASGCGCGAARSDPRRGDEAVSHDGAAASRRGGAVARRVVRRVRVRIGVGGAEGAQEAIDVTLGMVTDVRE